MSDVPVDMAPKPIAPSYSTLDGELSELPAHHVVWISFTLVAGTITAFLLA